jgi:hypothetical protein
MMDDAERQKYDPLNATDPDCADCTRGLEAVRDLVEHCWNEHRDRIALSNMTNPKWEHAYKMANPLEPKTP